MPEAMGSFAMSVAGSRCRGSVRWRGQLDGLLLANEGKAARELASASAQATSTAVRPSLSTADKTLTIWRVFSLEANRHIRKDD
jgi:hypothetical protein